MKFCIASTTPSTQLWSTKVKMMVSWSVLQAGMVALMTHWVTLELLQGSYVPSILGGGLRTIFSRSCRCSSKGHKLSPTMMVTEREGAIYTGFRLGVSLSTGMHIYQGVPLVLCTKKGLSYI